MFRLALLDTNVLSEVIKDARLRRRFFAYLNGRHTLPALSIWSIVEMRQRSSLWEDFLELFSVAPFVMFKPPQGIFQAELTTYPSPAPGAPIQYSFSPVDPNPQARAGAFFPRLFSDPTVVKAECAWAERWKSEIANSISSLKENFPPRGSRYDAADGQRFVDLGVPQWVMAHALRWSRARVRRNKPIEGRAFPSVAMNFWTVFFRFYAEDRIPELQDVFDILIASPAPYVEETFTEKFQAEIFRKVKRRGGLLDSVEEIRTLRDLR